MCVHQQAALLVGGVMLLQPTDCQLRFEKLKKNTPVKKRGGSSTREEESDGSGYKRTDDTFL